MGRNGFGVERGRSLVLVALCSALLSIAGCSDGGSDGMGTAGVAGLGGTGAVGGAAGASGNGGTGGGGIGGAAGMVVGGMAGGVGGMTGGVGGMTGGVGGMTGGVGGMTGGVGGMTGGVGGMGGTGGVIERGEAPTMESATADGPYTVESYTSGFRAPMNFAGGTIWHPTGADAPFGAIAICPGFLSPESSIAEWGPFLASHGIVVMTIETTTTGDQVADRAPALMDALAILKEENARSGSPLMGKIDVNRLGLMGWSMGGGATWINISEHPELRAAVSLCGHIATYPGGSGFASSITVPILMLAGSADNGILGGGMSQPMYDLVPETTDKMLFEMAGGDHYVANTPTGNGGAFGRYGLSWYKVFLEGDERYRPFLMMDGPNASDFRTNL